LAECAGCGDKPGDIRSPNGTPEPDNLSLSVTPNPASQVVVFNVTAVTGGEMQIQLYDKAGRLITQVFNGNLQGNESRAILLDLSRLPSGQYIYKVLHPVGTQHGVLQVVH
jgi:hypothetical protein